MLLVIGSDLLVTIKAQRDPVFCVVGSARGLIDDMSGFHVDATLLETEATPSMATNKHRRLGIGGKRH
jgi:hypothetical protein